MPKREALKTRKTKETEITIKLNIDGTGESKIDTGIGILDHMLELFAFHGLFDLEIAAKGDLKVDIHHTNEDVGIVLGDAFKEALGQKEGIKRFGSASVPMEEVVADVSVDISGRAYFKGISLPSHTFAAINSQENYSLEYANHFFEGFVNKLGANLVIKLETRNNPDLHTNLEPIFKALGIAMDQATQVDPRRKGIPSTKGIID
ncbi:MAG: imidazoleglycerol-phosphate dehydratase HisB [Candidatus Omnitrophota bacterium]|jgi:imidazoleglycerol-phosphate dehydratase|nr:MAG: imidazoleglycerol-phosphate dehydratase HisB [Candidatus Omnitrophota bacterium]